MTISQKKKKAVFLECLVIKEAIKFWQYWLIGRPFVVYSDHKPLENLGVNVRTDEELGDMMNFLSQFDFNKKIKRPIVSHEIPFSTQTKK